MPAYEVASYEPSDREAYLDLLREAWGGRAMSPAEFDWWFGANPVGSLVSVARRDGRVVGAAAHSLVRTVLDGEESLAAFSVHAVTSPSARGLGIFSALEEKHEREAAERGAAVGLVFANAMTAPIFLRRLGWAPIARLRVWARPLLAQARGPAEPASFDDPRDAAADWPNHVVRDAQHLSWRFGDSPRGYVSVRSERGYAVVGGTRYRGIETAVLADFTGGSRRLLRRAVSIGSGRAMIALPAPEQRALFLSLGFLPAPHTLNLLGKGLGRPLNADARAWRLTLGDTDFF